MEIYVIFIFFSISILVHSSFTLNFTIQDKVVTGVNKLTKATEVGGKYRYPCYVKAVVFDSPQYKTVVPGAVVTALSRDRILQNWYGYSQETTDANGAACLLVLCRQEAVIFTTYGETRLASAANDTQKKSVPPNYRFLVTKRNAEVIFNVNYWGHFRTPEGRKSGPVYKLDSKSECVNAGRNNFFFKFSFLGKEEKITFTNQTLQEKDFPNPHAWYYYDKNWPQYRVCYLKVQVITNSYQSNLTVKSYRIRQGTKPEQIATVSAGPIPNPNANTEIKAACTEILCPQQDADDNDMDTMMVAELSVPGKPNGCCARVATKIKTFSASKTGFVYNITTYDGYGPTHGIYWSSNIKDARERAKQECYTGRNDLPPGYDMNPGLNYAISYDCTKSCRQGDPQPAFG